MPCSVGLYALMSSSRPAQNCVTLTSTYHFNEHTLMLTLACFFLLKQVFLTLAVNIFSFLDFCQLCGCDTFYIVSVYIKCQASIYTLLLCRGHSWRVRLAKQVTLTPPGQLGLTSGLQGLVNVHRGALLLVPQ